MYGSAVLTVSEEDSMAIFLLDLCRVYICVKILCAYESISSVSALSYLFPRAPLFSIYSHLLGVLSSFL